MGRLCGIGRLGGVGRRRLGGVRGEVGWKVEEVGWSGEVG